MRHTVFLGMGSNVGDSLGYISQAIKGVADFALTTVDTVSNVYQTEPVGVAAQNDFLNVAVGVGTELEFTELYTKIKQLEQTIGRKASIRWGPREIDIDLLLFDDLIVSTDHLTVPHRELDHRKFVLQPLSEIASNFVHPVFKKTISMLNKECGDTHAVRYSEEHSTQLQSIIHDSIADPAC